MSAIKTNKRKIFNDPVYGFVSVPDELVFDIIEHPWFQRLRRIKQLGLTHLVYPGALHTRFQHSLGAMYLMQKAISELQSKGQDISAEEALGAEIAILLHDIGHGPFSHALEYSMVSGITHEEISRIIIDKLNTEFDNRLSLALDIFQNKHPKKYLGKLVSSQFDMDRLDYLKRDSFFSGVAEGVISYERLLKMLDVVNDELVIEAKGIYSVEKFITARRLMYWQVYLHKTVLAAEYMLMKLLKRAKELSRGGEKLYASPSLSFFLQNDIGSVDFKNNEDVLKHFALLDDSDIFGAMKVWISHKDKVLSTFSNSLVNRRLFKIEIQNEPFTDSYIQEINAKTADKFGLSEDETAYFVFRDKTSNYAYNPGSDNISILFKDGSIRDIADATDELNITLLARPVTKYFLCYPKTL